jgi:hypothetical protein
MGTRGSTHFLYAIPSFWSGWARILDFGDTLTEYNTSVTPAQADFLALKSDWYMVGDDIADVYAEALSAEAKAVQR